MRSPTDCFVLVAISNRRVAPGRREIRSRGSSPPARCDLKPPRPGARRSHASTSRRAAISRVLIPARLLGMRASFSAGWVLAVWLSSLFMTQLDVTIVNVAAPSMHADLGASGAELELVVGGYLLGFAVLLITGARLGALLGQIGR